MDKDTCNFYATSYYNYTKNIELDDHMVCARAKGVSYYQVSINASIGDKII
jgi:hypothetical protein